MAEEALDRAVHLRWDVPAQAASFQLERRRREGSDWTPWQALPAPGPDGHLDDTGPGGAGLAPGHYEYRLRRGGPGGAPWSAWSEGRAVELRPQCQDPTRAALPAIRASDRDADGRYTGRDVEAALRACSAVGGCVLEILPEVYDDVAVAIYRGNRNVACQPSRTACLDLPFPKGLIVRGHGSDSVLRSPLWEPGWKPAYKPVPVLELWNRPEIPFAMRNLVLDGRKQEQRAPVPGVNDAVHWWHYGFKLWNYWGDHSRRSQRGCIHNVHVRNLAKRGISIGDADAWTLEYNTVEDIGCHADVTPCPALEVPGRFAPGYQAAAVGIMIGWYTDDVVVRSNRIRRVTKYALGLKHGQGGDETSIRRPRVLDNEIEETGRVGIFLSGVEDGVFRDNRVRATQVGNEPLSMATANDSTGLSCNDRVERTRVESNHFRDCAGKAVQWACRGTGNAFSGNRIERSCRQKNPERCVPESGRCYQMPDLDVNVPAGSLELADNQVLETGCATPLGVRARQAPLELELRGGLYAAGPHARRPVRFENVDLVLSGGARFDGVALELGGETRGTVSPSVVAEKVRKLRGSEVLVCAQDRRACAARCAASAAPAWCTEAAPGARP